MLKHALRLATSFSWRVHPVHGIVDEVCTCGMGASCKSAGKHPVLGGWREMASAEPTTIESWDWVDKNIGVVPSGFCILDFDGAPGRRLLAQMSEVLGPVPDDTPIVQTGSGGYHVYVSGEAKTRAGLLPGLDIRGIGGQAVLPPSRHYSGATYVWLNPPTGPVPEAPQWLAVAQGDIPDELRPAEVVTLDQLKSLSCKKKEWTPALALALKGEVFAEHGERHARLTSIAGGIAWRWPYCDPEQVADYLAASIRAAQADGSKATREGFTKTLADFCESRREDLKRKPRIIITTDIDEMSDQAIAALATRSHELGLYTRGGELTRVRPPEDLPDGVLRGELPYAFERVAQGNLMAYLSSSAAWVRRNANEDTPKMPPPAVLARIDQRGAWPGIPHAERIAEGLILRPDGSIFRGGGYDEATGTVSLGVLDDEPLGSTEEAAYTLRDVVSEFPFAGEDHLAAWLASVLTSVGRQCFRGPSPMFLIDANVAAAGKSLLAELSILIATGRGPSRATVGHSMEEDRKQITALAMGGATAILVDNITGLFGTQKLCEALTLHDSSWSDRILGKSKTWSGPFSPTWWATANNVRLRQDIARRTCYIRIESDMERPELRTGFRRPSLLAWVVEHRAELYRAAVSLLHHYIMAGRPAVDIPSWGSYEGWSSLIRQTLLWSGFSDPAETREGLGVADEEVDLLRNLVEGLSAVCSREFSPGELYKQLYASACTADDLERQAQLRDALDTGCVQKQKNPSPQSIGRLLNRFRGRVVGGQQLVRSASAASRWQVKEIT